MQLLSGLCNIPTLPACCASVVVKLRENHSYIAPFLNELQNEMKFVGAPR